MKDSTKQKIHKIDNVVSAILLIAAIVLFGSVLYQLHTGKDSGEATFVFDHRPIWVQTGSMEPYMKVNSICITQKVDSIDDIAVNDVITYRVYTTEGEKKSITHRVLDIDENGLITTKGDNNQVIDAYPITIDLVEDKVIAVFNWTAWIVANPVVAGCFGVAIIMLFFAASLFFKKPKEKEVVKEVMETGEEQTILNGGTATGNTLPEKEHTKEPEMVTTPEDTKK